MIESILQYLQSAAPVESISTVAALIAAVLGFFVSILQAALDRRTRREYSQPTAELPTQLDLQVREIQDYLNGQRLKEFGYSFTNVVLNFSQYGVGAALVTTFVTENISPEILGILGAVTLLSSFTQQLVRPDSRRLAAARRVVRLRELLRRAQISLTEARDRADGQLFLEFAKQYLAELHRIQRSETGEGERDVLEL